MTQELLYTSAQQGLKPGSYGFCTVVATEGLPKVLQERLESLSGYEHPFALTDQRAPQNPVNYSHLTVTVANRRLHLLSRVADAGADYSGRSNKIAHHLVLDTSEVLCASPADVLAAPGIFKSSFEGAPHWLPPGAPPRLPTRPFGACAGWAQVCGDAGWAGALAQRTLKDPARPVTLIFAPGADVLPLVAEALSLLPQEVRWRTTFSTFFTKLPAGIDCQWRFVLDGTPAAAAARRNPQAPPIDLISPGPISETGPLIDAARSGRAPMAAETTISPARTVVAPKVVVPRSRTAEGSEETYRLGSVVPPPVGTGPGNLPAESLFAKPATSKRTLLFAGFGGGTVLAVVLGAAIWSLTRPPELPPVPVASREAADRIPDADIEKPDALKTAAERAADKEQLDPADSPPTSVAKTDEPPQPMPQDDAPPAVALPPVFENIQAKGKVLSLPKLARGLLEDATGPQELCKIYVENPMNCRLALVTAETFDGEQRLRLVPETEITPGQRAWTVEAHTKKTAVTGSQAVPIGQFVLHDASQDHALTFAWAKDIPEWANPFGLEYCKLDVEVGEDQIACQLSKPVIEHSHVRLDLQTRGGAIPIKIFSGSLASFDKVRFDLELHRGDWSQGVYQVPATETTPVKFRIPGDSQDGTGDVELEFRFLPPGECAEFACATFVFPAVLEQVPNRPEWKKEVKRVDQLEGWFKETKIKVKDGVVVPELDRKRIGKAITYAETSAKKMILEISDTKRAYEAELDRLQKLKMKLEKEKGELTDEGEAKLKALPNAIAEADQWIRHWEAFTKFTQAQYQWLTEMRQRLQDLEKTVEVRYSVYLDFGDERAVIAQTERAPQRPKTEAPEAKDQPE